MFPRVPLSLAHTRWGSATAPALARPRPLLGLLTHRFRAELPGLGSSQLVTSHLTVGKPLIPGPQCPGLGSVDSHCAPCRLGAGWDERRARSRASRMVPTITLLASMPVPAALSPCPRPLIRVARGPLRRLLSRPLPRDAQGLCGDLAGSWWIPGASSTAPAPQS